MSEGAEAIPVEWAKRVHRNTEDARNFFIWSGVRAYAA
jgi:hypothetical protein